MPTAEGWEDVPAGFYNFYKDPEKYPLTTPTGKLEFESTALTANFPDDLERPPVPKWIAEGISHEETIGTERGKKYHAARVLQPPALERPLPARGHHLAARDRDLQGHRSRRLPVPPVWLHPSEAEKRGISHGDIVSIVNERGTVLGGAYVTERVMPGVVYMDHGAKWDPIVPGEIDRGGAINTIVPRNTTSKNAVGHAVSGFLVDLEKTDMEDLKRKYPVAFERPFHPCAGPGLEACIRGVE